MNAYETLQSLTAKHPEFEFPSTNEGRVALLKTITTRNIPVKEVRRILREEGLLLWIGTEYHGLIESISKSPQAPVDLVAGVVELKSALFGGSAEELLTTQPKWAVKAFQIMSAIAQLAGDKSSVMDQVYALGGGRPFASLTIEQFIQQRTEVETQAAEEAKRESLQTRRDNLQQQFDAIKNQVGTVEQSLAVIALRQIANELEKYDA